MKASGRTMTLLGNVKPPPAGGKTMILVLVSCDTDEVTGRELYRDSIKTGPVIGTLGVGPYPQVKKQVSAVTGIRSSMKGTAFVLPLHGEFVLDVLAKYEEFTAFCEHTEDSLVAWELYDPCVVAKSDNGGFANRGLNLNSLIIPT
jgi:hypothetical protein